jgi:hypothetical protein
MAPINENTHNQPDEVGKDRIQKEQPWLELRENRAAGKEGKREFPPGQLHGIAAGQLLLFNGHGGAGRSFAKKAATPFQ